jgi:hypothetical protein
MAAKCERESDLLEERFLARVGSWSCSIRRSGSRRLFNHAKKALRSDGKDLSCCRVSGKVEPEM